MPTEPAQAAVAAVAPAAAEAPKGENITMAQLTALMTKPKGPAIPGTPPSTLPNAERGTRNADNPNPPEGAAQSEPGADPPAEPVLSDSPEPQPVEPDPDPGQPPALEEPAIDPTAPLSEVEQALADAKLPKGAQKMVKRIGDLVDQRDSERNRRLDAEARIAELETRNQELQSSATPHSPLVTSGSSPFDPIANHPDMQAVNTRIAMADQSLAWLRANPDGGELDDGKGGKQFLDADYVARSLAGITDNRTELIAQRGSLTANLRQSVAALTRENHDKALKLYPWHADRESPEHQAALKIVRQYPFLKDSPDYLLILGRMVEGQKVEVTRLKPAPAITVLPTKPAVAAKKPTPQPGRPAAVGARVDADGAGLKAAEEEFERTGSEKSLQKLRIAKRAARNSMAA